MLKLRRTSSERRTRSRWTVAGAAGAAALLPITALAAWGGFQPATAYPGTSSSLFSVAIGDVNRDGFPDIVASSFTTGQVLVYLNKGDGSFLPAVSQSFTGPFYIVLADLNGDGILDLAVAQSQNAEVGVAFGKGDGTFLTAVEYPVTVTQTSPPTQDVVNGITVGDVNGDGLPDLIVGTLSGVGVFINQPGGSFRSETRYATSFSTCGVVASHLRGSAQPLDIAAVSPATGGQQPTVLALPGVGDGTFGSPVSTVATGANCTVAAGDLNGDGRPDLVTGTSVLVNSTNDTFSATTVSIPGPATANAVADVNLDGKLDLVIAEQTRNSFAVLRGRGDGTFDPATEFGLGTGAQDQPLSIAVGDLNGDGAPDVVTGGTGGGQAPSDLNVSLNSGPPANVPESPLAVLLMSAGVIGAVGLSVRRRRRRRRLSE